MNKDLVIIFGNFNILHPGHLRLLRFAKSLNKKLVIGLYSDKIAGNAIFVPEKLRLDSILANSWVDDAFIVDDGSLDLHLTICIGRPCIEVSGCS